MGKNRSASGLTNIIQYDNRGNITFVSGSTTLMSVSSSGAITTTGTISGSDATNALLLNGTGSLAFTTTASYNVASASLSSRTTQVERTYANTGSNTFTGAQFISDTSNAISFTSTASLYSDGGLRVQGNSFVSGTAYFNNIVVYGTSSVQYITSSQVNVGTNIITVNTDTPSVRFGGLAVFDSGSTQLTGSILWDSEKNHWVYSNPSGSTYSGGMFISGPRSSALGSEQGTTSCMLLVGQGSDHLTSSMIYHSSTTTCIPNCLIIGGTLSGSSATFSSAVTTNSGVIGNNNNHLYLSSNSNCGEISFWANQLNSRLMTLTGAGDLGIGTATPGAKLDVSGNMAFSGYIGTGGLGSRLWIPGQSIGQTTYAGLYSMALTYLAKYESGWKSAGGGVASAITIDEGAFSFSTTQAVSGPNCALTWSTRLKIGSDGNAGIGTTTTYGRLHVNGPALQFDSETTYGIWVSSAATIEKGLILGYDNTNDTGVINAVQRGVGWKNVSIGTNSGGNVGIGTNVPNSKLEVYAGAGSVFRAVYAGTNIVEIGNYKPTSSGGAGYQQLDIVSSVITLGTGAAGGGSASEKLRITTAGTVQPGTNGTQDLGTSSLRWGTVFTSDLSMSNGIGDYTIVEGEDDLFLYNNKKNKVFKFVLAEVDPSTAPPKKS